MVGKNNANKEKGEAINGSGSLLVDSWWKCKCSETDLLRLVDEGLLEPKEII